MSNRNHQHYFQLKSRKFTFSIIKIIKIYIQHKPTKFNANLLFRQIYPRATLFYFLYKFTFSHFIFSNFNALCTVFTLTLIFQNNTFNSILTTISKRFTRRRSVPWPSRALVWLCYFWEEISTQQLKLEGIIILFILIPQLTW